LSHTSWELPSEHFIGGQMEERVQLMGRRKTRRKQLLDNREKTRGYWQLKEEALDCTLGRTTLGDTMCPL
jgi:hypothetical protein